MSTSEQTASKTSHWARQIRNWQKTNQSQSGYCRDHDLSYHRFTYWQRKLSGKLSPPRQPARATGFIPVKPVTPKAPRQELSLTLSSGAILQGITPGNLVVVKQLLGILQ